MKATAEEGTPEAWYLFDAKNKVRAGPLRTRQDVFDTKVIQDRGGKLPKGWEVLAVPEETVVVTCGVEAGSCPGVQTIPTGTFYYLFRYEPGGDRPYPQMTGRDLKLSGTRQDFDTQGGGKPIVLMEFTDAGDEKFHDITREIAQRGQLLTNTIGNGQDVFQHFAIVLDREIKSAPQIDWTEYPDGIGGSGGAQITGDFTVKEAQDLALVLQTGALPVKFTTQSQTEVSATLGADSLRQAQIAAAAGLIIVAIFLLHLLPLPRRRRGDRARDLRRRSCTRPSCCWASR